MEDEGEEAWGSKKVRARKLGLKLMARLSVAWPGP